MKKIWSASFIVSLIITYILASPSLEVYAGIPCPFGTFRDSTSTFFGVEFHGFIQQSIFITISGFLAIITELFACISIIELRNLCKIRPPLTTLPKKKIVDSKLNIENKKMGLDNFEGVMEIQDEGTLLCSKQQMKRIHDRISNNLNTGLL